MFLKLILPSFFVLSTRFNVPNLTLLALLALKYVILVKNHHYFLPIGLIFDRLLKSNPSQRLFAVSCEEVKKIIFFHFVSFIM